MKRSNFLIIFIASISLIGVVGFVILRNSNQTPKYTETTEKEPELADGKSIPLNNMSNLSNILLPKQNVALSKLLTGFILDYLDPNITSADLTSGPTVNQDGTVTFTMQAKAPAGKNYSLTRVDPNGNYVSGTTVTGTSKAATQFTITIFRDNYTSLTIKIPEYNYTDVEAFQD